MRLKHVSTHCYLLDERIFAAEVMIILPRSWRRHCRTYLIAYYGQIKHRGSGVFFHRLHVFSRPKEFHPTMLLLLGEETSVERVGEGVREDERVAGRDEGVVRAEHGETGECM